MQKDKISRRTFLKGTAAGVVGLAAAGFLGGCSGTAAEETTKANADETPSSNAEETANSVSEETAASAVEGTAGSDFGTRYTKASNPDGIGIVHDAQSEDDADVVVIGSGISGVTCAMVAAEQSPESKIIIVEARGICGGGTNFAEQPDMPAEGYDWISAVQYGDEVSAKTNFVKDARLEAERKYDMGRNSSWLFTKHAIPLTIKNFDRLKTTLDAFEQGQPVSRWNGIAGYEGGNGSLTIQHLVDEIENGGTYANVEIRLNTRGIALLLEDEHKITGVQVLDADGNYVNINAKAVVLACGGMSNNLELLQNYSNQELEHCVPVEQGHYGDGMLMAEQTAHGRCKTIALSSMQAYVDGMHYQSWLCLAAGQTNTALYVNQKGVRFVNEDMNRITEGATHPGVNRSKVVEGQGAVYSIIGSGLMDYYKQNGVDAESFYGDGQAERPFDLDADLELYSDNENVFVADTIEELAEKIGVPADALVQTVNTYNADAEAGTDSAFNKDPKYMIPLGEAPFYAFKLSSIIVNTNGGVRVDDCCRIVDQNFVPIEGLYATGLTISGFVTDVYETGNCQCVSIWSGLKAGRSLVEQCLGGTVADDWYGPSEWDAAKDLPNFANWDDYQAYVASL